MIDVALSRADLQDVRVAVVIDVLRATSTATQALAAGYESVLFTDSIERARGLSGPDTVLAGERRCVKPEGFDQGNSPLEASERRGRQLVLATTNGTPAIIAAVQRAPLVLLGCMLNLEAVIAVLARTPELDLQLVCSGTDGRVALEDVYLAGRVSAALPGSRTDAALVAEGFARNWRTPLDALAASADARMLRAVGLTADIACCALESEVDVVPVVRDAGAGMATAAPWESATAQDVDCPATVEV